MQAAPHPLLSVPSTDMKSRAVRGAIATSASQGVGIVVQFASVVFLARLLKPSDFGVYAMVTPLIGFSLLFQDFGLTQALVTAPELTQAQAAGMFRVNMALSVLLALVLAACAPLVGYFYHEPAAVWITVALAGQIILAGATACHSALLSRAMKFNVLSIITIIRTVGAFAVALVVAWLIPSSWALVSQTLASGAIGLVATWIATGWRPTGHISLDTVRPMMRFGVGMTSFNLTNYISRNADNILIGWANGPLQLGLYDRAYKLLLYPLQQINGPISGVMVPILARIADQPDRYRSAYMRTLRQTLLLTVPLVAFLICTAPVLIPTLMGPRWAAAIPIFQWLGLAGIHQTISNTFGWLFVTQRRTGEYARFGLFSTATCVIAFAGGLRWGAVGVAAAYAVSGVIVRLPVIVWQVGRRGPVSAGDIVRMFAPYMLALGIAVAVWKIAFLRLAVGPFVFLILSGILIVLVFWAVIAATPRGRETFVDAFGMLPGALGRRFREKAPAAR